jgi:hypothetical protein
VIDRTNKLDPASLDSDAESLGFRAFSLVRADRLDEANAIAAALKKREGNYRAAAWAAATPSTLIYAHGLERIRGSGVRLEGHRERLSDRTDFFLLLR